MENSIRLVYKDKTVFIQKLPKSYSELKKIVRQHFLMPESYYFLLSNNFGAKTPITTQQSYSRGLFSSETTGIELISSDSCSQEKYTEDDIQFSGNKHRVILSKKQKQKEEEKISHDEMCFICYEKLKMPMSAKCGHVFCKICWEKALKNFLECPMCKTRVRITQLKKVE